MTIALACKNNNDPAPNSTVAATGVTLNKTDVSVVEGNTETFTATVSPADAASKAVIGSSSDKNVLTVTASQTMPSIFQSKQKVARITKAQTKQIVNLFKLRDPNFDPLDPVYDIDVYRVTYTTVDYQGGNITSSGMVTLPQSGQNPVHMLSWQHDAPSKKGAKFNMLDINRVSGNTPTLTPTLMAPYGMVSALPDYIGVGSSENIFHPYFVDSVTATAAVDMIKAAKEFAEMEGINFDGKVIFGRPAIRRAGTPLWSPISI